MVRMVAERDEQPSAVIIDGRTLQSAPESGGCWPDKCRQITDGVVEIAHADQGYTGEDAATHKDKVNTLELVVVKHIEVKKGFVLLLRRWPIERTFGWLGRFRRLAHDYEHLSQSIAGSI